MRLIRPARHPDDPIRPSIRAWLPYLLAALVAFPSMALARETVHIGVLEYRPLGEAQTQWDHLSQALNKAIPEYQFDVRVYDYQNLTQQVEHHALDFVLTNPTHYVLLAHHNELTAPLVTQISREGEQLLSKFGGVIFARADRDDIRQLGDLENKTIAAVFLDSLGGYQAQAYEFMIAKLPIPDQRQFLFTGMPHDQVVYAVLQGRADAGFARSGVLEHMAAEGKIDLRDVKIIHPLSDPGFPYRLSTKLYPEWPLVSVGKTSPKLRRELVAFLLSASRDRALMDTLRIGGFDLPAGYGPVYEMMHQLGVPPYDLRNRLNLREVTQQYWKELLLLFLVLLLVSVQWLRTRLLNVQLKRSQEEIWQHANLDPLTNLPNRRLFHDRLELQVRQSQRDRSQFALLFIDLDLFKEVNDTLGHHRGDDLLRETGRRLRACVREADTVARLGGDEFTVILTELQDPSDTGKVSQTILDALAVPFRLGDEEVYLTGSIGITVYPEDGATADDLLKTADQAMYTAKRLGRNSFQFFTPAMQQAAQIRMRLARDMRSALENGEFEVYYQPIVELSTGRIRKAEALLRWKHHEHGFISPAAFIPVAEETGVIHDIGDWVFKQAVEHLWRFQAIAGADFQVSINKSPVQIRDHQGRLHQNWADQLATSGLDGRGIVLEITEGLLLNAEETILQKFQRFRDCGIQVAIDDFGTGYSALSYLKKFHVDYLKIDKSFTSNLAAETDDLALCEAIVVMAHKMGIRVIAEGVETTNQLKFLQEMGCDYGQGYLFARPMPMSEFLQQLTQQP